MESIVRSDCLQAAVLELNISILSVLTLDKNNAYHDQTRTAPVGHREIPGGPLTIEKYYIKNLMFLQKRLRM